MAYRENTTVISVPVSTEHNKKLIDIADKKKVKSKTRLAKTLLEKAIDKEYKRFKKKKDDSNVGSEEIDGRDC